MRTETLKLRVIQLDDGYCIELKDKNLILNSPDSNEKKSTFHCNWFLIDRLPEKVLARIEHKPVNKRFELIDPSYESPKIPLVVSFADAYAKEGSDDEYEDESGFNSWFTKIVALYQFKQDELPDTYELVPFEIDCIAKVNSLVPPVNAHYDVNTARWTLVRNETLNPGDINYALLDQIIFPPVLLPLRPCCIKAKDLFRIIQNYVTHHINPKYARITWNFSHTLVVDKIIYAGSHCEPHDINQFSKGKNKRAKNTRKQRTTNCLRITFNEKSSDSDSMVLKDLYGENQEDLKNKVDTMCKNIVDMINEPLVDCPHCDGTGVVLDK